MMYELLHGNSLDVLKTMEDNSVDSIVTDPPYGISFMGKKWDYDVPTVELWKECFRVLKPGGHLLSFAGTRTQHRMAVNIEDAGFEIRDMIAWIYGSGFPKSLDVSKAIDKANAEVGRLHKFTAWMRTTGLKAAQINDALKSAGLISKTSNFAVHYFNDSQPAIPTIDMWRIMRELFDDVPPWIDELVERIEAEREVVGRSENGISGGTGKHAGQDGAYGFAGEFNITAPATPAAKQWHGWGTALKPALEPITVARKPLIGTVAENVLTYGTGGINVDGCRVEYNPDDHVMKYDNYSNGGYTSEYQNGTSYTHGTKVQINTQGRWPANVIHDGSEEVVGLFPETKSGKMGPQHTRTTDGSPNGIYGKFDVEHPLAETYGDSGSAARFFYCAKASKRDRDEGCEGFQAKSKRGPMTDSNWSGNERFDGAPLPTARNHHPTVKPTDLMRYLCRLVTPPNGTVLDPFMGSGSTGKAAILENFSFIGIDMEKEYVDIAEARINYVFDVVSRNNQKEQLIDNYFSFNGQKDMG